MVGGGAAFFCGGAYVFRPEPKIRIKKVMENCQFRQFSITFYSQIFEDLTWRQALYPDGSGLRTADHTFCR